MTPQTTNVSPDGPTRTAIVIGASSGIGEALVHELHRNGWRLGLLARRLDRLEAIAKMLGPETLVRQMDIGAPDASKVLEGVIADLNGVDLVIISAGAVTLNPDLRRELDIEVIRTNVTGFMAMSQTAMCHFLQRGYGHLVGITSMAALRGDRSLAAYAASKSFQSIYLDGLRDLVKKKGLAITVTEAQPGFVDTAMMKTDKPLPSLIRRFMVASPQTAAKGIMKAIQAKSKHVYITRRYLLVALMLRLQPRAG